MSNNTEQRGVGEDSKLADKTETIKIWGRKYTLSITQLLYEEGSKRYSDIEELLDAPSSTLSNRLDQLEDMGIVYRESYNEIPPRVEYGLTPQGETVHEKAEKFVDSVMEVLNEREQENQH